MPDLPDYYTQITTPVFEAKGLYGGAEISRPAVPTAKHIYLATDTDRLFYSIEDEVWRGYFLSSRLLTANSLLYAVDNYTPIALPVPASRIIGRKAAGDMGALTGAEIMAILSGKAGAAFSMNSKKITNLLNPVANQDADTKKARADALAAHITPDAHHTAITPAQVDTKIATHADDPRAHQPDRAAINFIIDGGGSAITAGQKGHLEIPWNCEIVTMDLLADQVGSIVIDIWKDTYSNFPPTDGDSITSATPPTITGAQKGSDSIMTDWTTTLTSTDILAFNVDSCTTITRVTLVLLVTKLPYG